MNQPFGEAIQPKGSNVIRIVWSNIGPNGFGMHDHSQIANLRDFLRSTEADIWGAAEVGVNWSIAPRNAHPNYALKSNQAIRVQTGQNSNESIRSKQYGGTMLAAFDQAATQKLSSGTDPTGLGRWTWMRFQDNANQCTRLYSCYRPCSAPQTSLQAVYTQHSCYF